MSDALPAQHGQTPFPVKPFDGDAVPALLKSHKRWAPWRAVWDQTRNKGLGKWDKVPAGGLSTTKPERWMPYETAHAEWQRKALSGLGYVVTGCTDLVFVDLDDCVDDTGAPQEWAAEVIAQMGSYTERTPSGKGFRVIAAGTIPADWTNHERGIEVYAGHEARFLTITGDHLEGTPREVLSTPDAALASLSKRYAKERRKADVVDISMPDVLDPLVLPDPLSMQLPDAVRRFLETGEHGGDRSAALFSAGVALCTAGAADDEVLSMLAANPHSWGCALDKRRQDPQRALLYLWREHCVKARARSRSSEVTAADFDVVAPPPDKPTLPGFERDKNGRILATADNTQKALRDPIFTGLQVAYDLFTDDLMIAPAGSVNQWRRFVDTDYMHLRVVLARRGFHEVGQELIRAAVGYVAAEQRFDSAQVWLEGLPAWDGVERCETFLETFLGAKPEGYTRAASLYLWSAMAGRVMHPGVQADMALVLLGGQGKGKTTAVKALVPAPEHYVEINLEHRDDNLARSLRGKLIGELGELRGLAGRESEDIKAWVSRTHEEWVPKYKEFATKFPRRLVLIGTSNPNLGFLVDPTGNRRWLPVDVAVDRRIDVEGIRRWREQLWAEARERFALLGVEWQDADRLAEQARAAHMVTDSWQDEVARWLDEESFEGDFPRNRKFLRIGDVLRGAVGIEPKHVGRREEFRMGNVLRAMGYVRRKVRDGDRVIWGYLFPFSEEEEQEGERASG